MLPTQSPAIEWAKARGFKMIQQNDHITEFWVPSVCPHLKEGNCDLHGEHKPLACKEFPGSMIDFWTRNGLDPNKSLGEACGFRVVPDNPA